MVDDSDFEYLSQWKWSAVRCTATPTWYALRRVGTKKTKGIRMHVVIFGSKFPDHIDRNGLNNQRNNLREASKSQNGANSKIKKNNASGFKGVWWSDNSKSWQAAIMCNGKRYFLGCHSNIVDAAKSYDSAAEKLFGEFAATNQLLGLLMP